MTPAIVIVNFRGAADTLECLESVFRSTVHPRVVVIDNASGDGSGDAIAAWAAGERTAPDPSPALATLSRPPVAKPVPLIRLNQAESEAAVPADVPLTLIDAAANRGFAAGNNIGLRYLLRDPGVTAVWLLNPDTVVAADALAALGERLAAPDAPGMCGTTVRYYHRPDRLQALGGHRFNQWTGTSRGIGGETLADLPCDVDAVAAQTDFVLGASLAVSRAFLETVGLMAEQYFLYFEEIDWAWRNAGRFPVGFAPNAVVWHKEGGSIGSSSRKGTRSDLSEYYLMRSKLRLIGRFRPWLLPVHWGYAGTQIAARLVRRQPRKAMVMTRALFGLKT